MGLDMYLTGKKFFGGKYNEKEEFVELKRKAKWEEKEKVLKVNVKDIGSIVFDFGYWRKANAIHKWFVDHCWDGKYEDYKGEEIYVSKEQLEELRDLCIEVKAEILKKKTFATKKKVIDKMLPMQDGFFFGYDNTENGLEYYLAVLNDTIKILDDTVKKIHLYDTDEICYSASW